jgi:hypothetical protein
MQMRLTELPKDSHRKRLAAPGIAKTLRWVFLRVPSKENRGIGQCNFDPLMSRIETDKKRKILIS